MKENVHREIAKQIGERLDPNQDWKILIGASAAPDWSPSDMGHHRRLDPMQDAKEIRKLISKARVAYLADGFSDEFQKSLGKAFHYIQDRFIQSTDRSLHNRYEAAISRALPGLVPYGQATLLQGEEEILSYLRNKVKFIEDPHEILQESFIVCLSVAKAICDNERGFSAGVKANEAYESISQEMQLKSYKDISQAFTELLEESHTQLGKFDSMLNKVALVLKDQSNRVSVNISHDIDALIDRSHRCLNAINRRLEQTISETKSSIAEINDIYRGKSFFGRFIRKLLLQHIRYQKRLSRVKQQSTKKIETTRTQSENIYNRLKKRERLIQYKDQFDYICKETDNSIINLRMRFDKTQNQIKGNGDRIYKQIIEKREQLGKWRTTIKGLLDENYERAYRVRQSNPAWYRVQINMFRSPEELKTIIEEADSIITYVDNVDKQLHVDLKQINEEWKAEAQKFDDTGQQMKSKLDHQASVFKQKLDLMHQQWKDIMKSLERYKQVLEKDM